MSYSLGIVNINSKYQEMPMLISIVVPIYNEEESLYLFHEKLSAELNAAEFDTEILFINDGSTDSSGQKLQEILQEDQRVKIIELSRNFGQTSAMMAGFDFASGEIIISMDGDMQNDPKDIPRLVNKIIEGYDVCSGWRKERKDQLFKRRIPSIIANKMISWISGVRLHDYGCTLKAYKKEIIKGIKLYGEMHRFIPIYASWRGARIAELPVSHFSRTYGKSKYGMERTFKVLLDLIVLRFFLTLSSKPIYIFGGFGVINIMLSFLCFVLMLYYKFWGGKTFIETPLPQLVVLFFLVGFISILMGFLAEILMRTYYESQDKSIYSIRETSNLEKK